MKKKLLSNTEWRITFAGIVFILFCMIIGMILAVGALGTLGLWPEEWTF